MKNTGIEYLSAEETPVISPAFSDLLPPLPEEQLSLLEADILAHGCYSPIIVNEELEVVDGHHRFQICEEHGLPYKMSVFAFEDVLEAQQWALDTQKARRNLSAWEIGQIVLKLKPGLEEKARETMGARSDLFQKSEKGSAKNNTTKFLADMADTSTDTMNKIIQIDEKAPAPIKEALDKKEISVNKGYEITKQLASLPEGEREAAAEEAIAKANQEYRKGAKKMDDNTKTAKAYSNIFEQAALLDDSEQAVRVWIEWSGIRKDEITDMIAEANNAAAKFSNIAEILEEIHEKEVAPYEGPDDEIDGEKQAEDTE